jgi:hypothetical protein
VNRFNVVPEMIHAPQFYIIIFAFGMFTRNKRTTSFGVLFLLQVMVIKMIILLNGTIIKKGPLMKCLNFVAYAIRTLCCFYKKKKAIKLRFRCGFELNRTCYRKFNGYLRSGTAALDGFFFTA